MTKAVAMVQEELMVMAGSGKRKLIVRRQTTILRLRDIVASSHRLAATHNS